MLERLVELVPKSVFSESGSVFYSGRAAFASPNPLYILGFNPGGSPDSQADETVEWHTRNVLEKVPSEWSEYRDESWRGMPPGLCGLQPRVLHLLRAIGINPGLVPSSNMVFVRSTRESTFGRDISALAEQAWPFHKFVISQLGTKVILCFGKTAGNWVARRVGATRQVAEFVEKNDRRWRSVTLANNQGIFVIVASHPSVADWTAPETDPTPLVRQALDSISAC
ncbi:hypothetical protein [Aquisalimonas sp.]|uniref:hypothetical protein n=1 Tax=Aquisalimonas sp. TaxID=1872621 RepID=UPI0025C394C5|nr:hypothetical protein [Aquisalimonas sp.]